MSEWLYFGCHREPGHYVWQTRMRKVHVAPFSRLDHFDGALAPPDTDAGYLATLTRLGGWGLSALSFWDYTIDKRSKSNSIFFAPSLTVSPEALMAGAARFFPEVWQRLPDLRWHQSARPFLSEARRGDADGEI